MDSNNFPAKNIPLTILRLIHCVEHKVTIIFQTATTAGQSLALKLLTLEVATAKTYIL